MKWSLSIEGANGLLSLMRSQSLRLFLHQDFFLFRRLTKFHHQLHYPLRTECPNSAKRSVPCHRVRLWTLVTLLMVQISWNFCLFLVWSSNSGEKLAVKARSETTAEPEGTWACASGSTTLVLEEESSGSSSFLLILSLDSKRCYPVIAHDNPKYREYNIYVYRLSVPHAQAERQR